MDQLASAFAAFIPGSDYVWWSWVLFSWRLLARLVSSRLVSFVFRNRRAERRENRAEAEQSVLMKLRTSLSRATYASNI